MDTILADLFSISLLSVFSISLADTETLLFNISHLPSDFTEIYEARPRIF